MENKGFWIKVLVIILVLGMVTVVCYGQSTDSNLNGTWVGDEGKLIWNFNNGNFEMSRDGVLYGKGTYTISAGKIFFISTDSSMSAHFSLNGLQLSYSINENILIVSDGDGIVVEFTRKN
jgi:hypothetical protein